MAEASHHQLPESQFSAPQYQAIRIHDLAWQTLALEEEYYRDAYGQFVRPNRLAKFANPNDYRQFALRMVEISRDPDFYRPWVVGSVVMKSLAPRSPQINVVGALARGAVRSLGRGSGATAALEITRLAMREETDQKFALKVLKTLTYAADDDWPVTASVSAGMARQRAVYEAAGMEFAGYNLTQIAGTKNIVLAEYEAEGAQELRHSIKACYKKS